MKRGFGEGIDSTDEQKVRAALGMACLSRYGCSPLLKLLVSHGPEAVWRASMEGLGAWGVAPKSATRFDVRRRAFDIRKVHRALVACRTRFVPFGASGYPSELAQLLYPPAGFFFRGSQECLERFLRLPRVTIVGTRRASPYGRRVTGLVTRAFALRGVAVVSGLALGIDGEAHRTAIENGGLTAAVLGCGTDIIYPARHRGLHERLEEGGLILSEYPPGTCPARWTFPQRNRLLAALGDAVVVCEGCHTSGAMQTAAAALELGRPVFTIPGRITDSNHEGCNWLVYDGAIPIVDPEVAVEEFMLRTRIERGRRRLYEIESGDLQGPALVSTEGAVQAQVLAELQRAPETVDALVAATGLTARQVTVALAESELRGVVARSAGGLWMMVP
jgi:DNA processing protein